MTKRFDFLFIIFGFGIIYFTFPYLTTAQGPTPIPSSPIPLIYAQQEIEQIPKEFSFQVEVDGIIKRVTETINIPVAKIEFSINWNEDNITFNHPVDGSRVTLQQIKESLVTSPQ